LKSDRFTSVRKAIFSWQALVNLDMRLAITHSIMHAKFLIFGLEYDFLMILTMGHSSREQTLLPINMIRGRNTQVVPLVGGAHLSQSSRWVVLNVSVEGRFLFD
jgi:hypothetical protein